MDIINHREAGAAMSDKLMVISADGHVTARQLPDFRPFLDPGYREAFDESVEADKAVFVKFEDLLDPGLLNEYRERFYESGAIDARWDADLRTRLLAQDGVVGEVVFPDGAPFGAGAVGPDLPRFEPDHVLAGARAYNRWAEEAMCGRPNLAVQACIAIDDPNEAAKDVYWAKEHGFRGLYMPANDFDRPYYWDPMYEPFWNACEDVSLPLHFHGGRGFPRYRFGNWPEPAVYRVMGFEMGFYAHRALWILIWGGVLERHPALRIVFTESHCDWVAEALAKMDWSWLNGRYNLDIRKTVPRLPSEYFERQAWLGASLLARGDLINRHDYGEEKLMFGVDFPHPESTWGKTKPWLQATVGHVDMTEPEIRAFLGETAAKVYEFDVDALQPDVERHGLTMAEVTTPLPQEIVDGPLFKGHDPMRPTVTLTQVR